MAAPSLALARRRAAEAARIADALAAHGGNRTRAAEALGYADAHTMRRAARRAGLDLAAFPAPTPQEYGALRRNGDVPMAQPTKG